MSGLYPHRPSGGASGGSNGGGGPGDGRSPPRQLSREMLVAASPLRITNLTDDPADGIGQYSQYVMQPSPGRSSRRVSPHRVQHLRGYSSSTDMLARQQVQPSAPRRRSSSSAVLDRDPPARQHAPAPAGQSPRAPRRLCSTANPPEAVLRQMVPKDLQGSRPRFVIHVGSIPNSCSAPVSFHGDRVMFAESALYPGLPVVCRSEEDQASSPDRLHLDDRNLEACPPLEGELFLSLLSLQHNHIAKIAHLSNLQNLVFLDLYDNEIETISGIDRLPALRVLMLGKNRIAAISGLAHVPRLDVLDLNDNQISTVEHLGGLTNLRVLNLASNQVEKVDELRHLVSLSELNLRHNKITTTSGLGEMNIERLYLSHNCISLTADAANLLTWKVLQELAFDGNPIAKEAMHRERWIHGVRSLRLFNNKRVGDDERRMAGIMVRKEAEKLKEIERAAHEKLERVATIKAAAEQWKARLASLERQERRQAKAARPRPFSASPTASAVAHMRPTRKQSASPLGRSSFVGLEPLAVAKFAEVENDTLFIYGPAFDALDRNWPLSVTHLCLQYVLFDELAPHLGKVRYRLPNVVSISFKDTELRSLRQINQLTILRRLEHLVIDVNQPLVRELIFWRRYVVFRLSHLPLKTINGTQVTLAEQQDAGAFFSALRLLACKTPKSFQHHLGASRLPYHYVPEGRLRRSSSQGQEPTSRFYRQNSRGSRPARPAPETPVDKRTDDEVVESAHLCVSAIIDRARTTSEAVQGLDAVWDECVAEIVRDALRDVPAHR